jgi:hypothetical protein
MQLIEAYYTTIRHYFRAFFQWINQIPDWRESKKSSYSVQDIIAAGLAIFLLKLESRRGFNEQRGRKEFDTNVAGLLHAQQLPHGDSINYFLKELDPKHLEEIRKKMVYQLLRNKVISEFRVQGYYIVVFDATGSISFREPHCPHCLRRKLNNGEIMYYHPILEAKIVCANGFAFSIGTEFLSNADGNDRQDCELKAFYRLARRIKEEFPRLPICIVGDGLYAGQPTFALCEELGWKYFTVLKEGDLKSVWEEVEGLRGLCPENHFKRMINLPDGKQMWQECFWTLDISYHEQTIHVLEYTEQVAGKDPHHWAWATNIAVKRQNCFQWSQAARLRWKIENEGFNMQKHGGYALSHVFSYDINAYQNFYLLMQIAHIIHQLFEKGSLRKLCFDGKIVSLITICRDLLAEVKMACIDWLLWRQKKVSGFQIRLDTS